MNRRDAVKGLAAAGLAALLPGLATARDEVYLAAYTRRRLLVLARGGEPLEVVDPLARGSGGVAPFRLRDSAITPAGEYRISWVNDASRFHRFFGINYPLPEQAYEGYRRGLLTREETIAVYRAHQRGETPLQTTRLGGHIGLHGLGGRNPRIHAAVNWTDGCLAVTDEAIDRLAGHIEPGMRVLVG